MRRILNEVSFQSLCKIKLENWRGESGEEEEWWEGKLESY